MSETRTIRDPFLGKDVQISDRLLDRLRGKYAVGPRLPNGEPEFGWRNFPTVPIQIEAAEEIEKLRASRDEVQLRTRELEKLVYVPGLWRCPKCKFSLLQSNLNMQDGTVTARDQPGDKCPNCDSPLWRVTERQAGNDMVDRAEEQMNRAVAAEKAVGTAIGHIEHMAAWITKQNAGYSFEGLGEDMPDIRAVLGKAT